jgi:hypothetical protein
MRCILIDEANDRFFNSFFLIRSFSEFSETRAGNNSIKKLLETLNERWGHVQARETVYDMQAIT